MDTLAIIAVVGLNLGLIFLLMAAPVGRRTVSRTMVCAASPERLWSALWPLGAERGWSGEVLGAEDIGDGEALLSLSWPGRDGRPIMRRVRLSDVEPGRRYSLAIVDDSSLDPAFWASYREEVTVEPAGGRVRVTVARTDRYRGLAFMVFRWFALRRELAKLAIWAETGTYRPGGVFERPSTQIGFALLSVLILWPVFGLDRQGLLLAAALTAVVALHELGHLAAFRLMGHRNVRMIFIPVLGGVAIGGRPYDRTFEIAFVAMMGAGFSAFAVAALVLAGDWAAAAGHGRAALACTILGGLAALFNLANLVPVWKFDGGQALRQIVRGGPGLAAASFIMLAAFLWVGGLVGMPLEALVSIGCVFAILSVMTAGQAVRPRAAMVAMRPVERVALAAALAAIFVIHGGGLVWAAARAF